MVVVRMFDVLALPVAAAAKRAGDAVVVVLRQGLCSRCRRRLVKQLLTPEELAAYDERSGEV